MKYSRSLKKSLKILLKSWKSKNKTVEVLNSSKIISLLQNLNIKTLKQNQKISFLKSNFTQRKNYYFNIQKAVEKKQLQNLQKSF